MQFIVVVFLLVVLQSLFYDFSIVSPSKYGSDFRWFIRLDDSISPNHPGKHIRPDDNIVAQWNLSFQVCVLLCTLPFRENFTFWASDCWNLANQEFELIGGCPFPVATEFGVAVLMTFYPMKQVDENLRTLSIRNWRQAATARDVWHRKLAEAKTCNRL